MSEVIGTAFCSKCGREYPLTNIGLSQHTCFAEYYPPATETVDLVNHPPHYKRGGMECIDVIDAIGANFYVGQVFKYLWRHGEKDPTKKLEDCRKARWYLDRYISNLKKEKG